MTGARSFHGVSFRPRDQAVREFDESALSAELSDREVFSWIDVEDGDVDALLALLDRMRVDRKVVDRLGTPEVLPWIVERPNCIAFRIHEIERPEAHLDTSRGITEMEATTMLVVLGTDFVLTWHPRAMDVVDEVRATAADAFRLAGRTPGFVAFLFLQRCLYDYADLNLANDNFLDRLDTTQESSRAHLAREIGIAGRNILLLKKIATSLHIVCMLLATKKTPFVSDEARSFFRVLQDNAMSVRSAVDSSRDLLDGVVGAIQAEAANRTTRIATVLTVLSAILLPLSLVAGLWGMNFASIPLATAGGGFWWLVGGMVVFAAVLVGVFRRLGWIGR